MPTDKLIGTTIGPYEILEKIGQGGMAEVYKGRHCELQRLVAIKFLGVHLKDDEQLTQRFKREARAIAALRHPNIVMVHDFGVSDHGHYMVMEYIEGADLRREMIRRSAAKQPYTSDEILNLATQIASALDYAHNQGVIHRDVKPGNIFVNPNGQAILGDFGLVMLRDRISQMTLGSAFGTPEYIAPEQAMDSRAAVPQSDIYALGGIVYELVTGQLPFEADSPLSLALKHVSEEPTPPRKFNPTLPPAVETVILRALAKAPEERYATAQAFVEALRQAWKRPAAPTTSATPVRDDTIPPPPYSPILDTGPLSMPGPPISQPASPLKQAPPAAPPPTIPPAPAQSSLAAPLPAKKRRGPWRAMILLLFLTALGGVGYAGYLSGAFPFLQPPEPPTAIPTATASPTPTLATVTTEGTPLTIASTGDIATPSPTITPEAATETPTPTPTATATPTPTDTPTPTPSPTATPTPQPTPTPTLAPGEVMTRTVDGMVMRFIPAGMFLMGAPDSDPEARAHEKPQHEVTLSAYWMDQTEVTTDQYKLCVAAGACDAPYTKTAYDNPANGNHPMVLLSWEEAAAYCQWVGEQTGWDAHLPSEAQWEKAASWDPISNSKRLYPWGDELDKSHVAVSGRTSPVGSYPTGASAYGILDMAGNVWEWVYDWYNKDYYKTQNLPPDPTGPEKGTNRVFRGGSFESWSKPERELRVTYREIGAPASVTNRPAKGPNLGFRCAVSGERLP